MNPYNVSGPAPGLRSSSVISVTKARLCGVDAGKGLSLPGVVGTPHLARLERCSEESP